MLTPTKKLTSSEIKKISIDIDSQNYLLKDFKFQVTQNDFLKIKEESNKNFGFFDEIMSLLYKNNKTVYYVKIIDKKNIINNSFQNILNAIYKLNKNDYMINLQTVWEDNERLFLVFDGIKRYSLLENLLKNNSENMTEENIIIIFRQILEVAKLLQENQIFGCNYYMNSFIYDKNTKTIKLTDLGFSKIFKPSKNINDNKLQNGFEFNDYYPPECFNYTNIYDQDKIKNSYFDIWQLGILFYKIATFGESPFDDAKNENLKESIMTNNINYSRLNKYSPLIPQIIDKMLQIVPTERYTLEKLLNLEPFKINNKIQQLIINPKNEEKSITLNMVNNEKGKDVKIDMVSLLDDMEAQKKASKEISNIYKEEKEKNANAKILKKVRIQGNLVNDKNTMVSQEIYPDGSVLPIFKNNKYLNKFNNVDNNLVLDLSNKLSLLQKEYKKLDENKLAVYNITNYVNNNIKELNNIDNDNIELLIKKFSNLHLSKIETNDLYEEMVRNKGEFAQDKFKALISNLIYEIKRLEIELEQEKSTSEKLRKKIKEQEKRNMDLKNECQEKVEFYEKKIELLEEVIFNVDNKSLNTPEEIKKNNKLIYDALVNSIKDFTNVNIQLKTSLEENLEKFKENKKFWLQDIIKAKENFRNEMKFYLQKSIEQPKIYNFEKKENKEASNKNEKEEIIKELKRKITELNDLVNDQKTLIDHNTNFIKELKKEIKSKDEKIEELLRLLNNKEQS